MPDNLDRPHYPDAYARAWPSKFRDDLSAARFNQFCQGQLEELMTHYGKIDMLWYDGCCASSGLPEADGFVKALQPEITINAHNSAPDDFRTPTEDVVGFNRLRRRIDISRG